MLVLFDVKLPLTSPPDLDVVTTFHRYYNSRQNPVVWIKPRQDVTGCHHACQPYSKVTGTHIPGQFSILCYKTPHVHGDG